MRPLLAILLAAAALPARAADPEIAISLDSAAVEPKERPKGEEPLPPAVSLRIDKENATLVWTDTGLKKHTYQLDAIENHPGPRPWSENLAWLVARGKDDFWVFWLYVNETGTGCWSNYYHFAENRIRMERLRGTYVWRPPEKFSSSPFDIDIPLDRVPKYAGRPFKHKDFGPEGGKFTKLRYLEGTDDRVREEELQVKPLFDLDVRANNGWEPNPWSEVHALARNAEGTRLYYVVTYTAVDHGWVVDLREGRVLYTKFGEAVKVEPREKAEPKGETRDPK